MVAAASRQPASSIPEFGRAAAIAYYDKQMRSGTGGSLVFSSSEHVTFSIVDLARIPALLEQLDTTPTHTAVNLRAVLDFFPAS